MLIVSRRSRIFFLRFVMATLALSLALHILSVLTKRAPAFSLLNYLSTIIDFEMYLIYYAESL